jgi:hypothetical protein
MWACAKGEAGTAIYSRDSDCSGQELVRSFSMHCSPFYGLSRGSIGYFKFDCVENGGLVSLTLTEYADNLCEGQVINSTSILGDIRADSCDTNSRNNADSYGSIQLVCGAIPTSKQYEAAKSQHKVSFHHYSNYDPDCASNPSVIELVS